MCKSLPSYWFRLLFSHVWRYTVWDGDGAATQEDKQDKLERTLEQVTTKPQVARRGHRSGNTIRYQQARRTVITVYDTPQLQYTSPRVVLLSKNLDHSQVRGPHALAPQAAGHTTLGKDASSIARHREEVANDVGGEISADRMPDVLRWFLQRFFHRDGLPFVCRTSRHNHERSTEPHQRSDWLSGWSGQLQLDWYYSPGETTGGYGWLCCLSTGRILTR